MQPGVSRWFAVLLNAWQMFSEFRRWQVIQLESSPNSVFHWSCFHQIIWNWWNVFSHPTVCVFTYIHTCDVIHTYMWCNYCYFVFTLRLAFTFVLLSWTRDLESRRHIKIIHIKNTYLELEPSQTFCSQKETTWCFWGNTPALALGVTFRAQLSAGGRNELYWKDWECPIEPTARIRTGGFA